MIEQIVPWTGYYIVREYKDSGELVLYHVYKDRTCTCGKDDCAHIKAVESYLRAGGERCLDKDWRPSKPEPGKCPICGGATMPSGSKKYKDMWACEKGGMVHFFQWYGEEHHVKEFMTNDRE